MRAIPEDIRSEVLSLWLENFTYQQISEKKQISLGCISNIINEFREKSPDLDSLRKLSCLLKKHNLNVYDAVRGAQLSEKLGELAVNFQILERYIATSERIAEEKQIDKPVFVQTSIELMTLEKKTHKPCGQVLEDYCKKLEKNIELEKRKKFQAKKLASIKKTSHKALDKYIQIKEELESVIETKTGIRDIGIDRFSQTLIFIKDFEALGLDIEEVKELDQIKNLMTRLSIDPIDLKEQLGTGILQEAQIYSRRRELNDLGNKITYHRMVENSIITNHPLLQKLNWTLSTGTMYVHCSKCQTYLPIPLLTRETINHSLNLHQLLSFWCPKCGWFALHPYDIIKEFGYGLLP